MTDARLTSITALTTPAVGDLLYIVDVSDTSEHAGGSSRKIALSDLLKATTDTSNPSSAPSYRGQLFLNTVTRQVWIALGVSATSDWAEILTGGNP
jgi:hypothetical protein